MAKSVEIKSTIVKIYTIRELKSVKISPPESLVFELPMLHFHHPLSLPLPLYHLPPFSLSLCLSPAITHNICQQNEYFLLSFTHIPCRPLAIAWVQPIGIWYERGVARMLEDANPWKFYLRVLIFGESFFVRRYANINIVKYCCKQPYLRIVSNVI